MTDRTLLEAAARAAGMDGWTYHDEDGGAMRSPARPTRYGPGHTFWSPLHDDGDALRLAAALEIDIMFRVVGGTRVEALAPGGPRIVERYVGAEGRAIAARRAVVRAAAACRGPR